MLDLTGAVAAVRAAVAGALGFSPSARLRADVYKDIALIKALDEHQMSASANRLRGLVDRRCQEIVRRGSAAIDRQRPSSTLVVSMIFFVPLGVWGWQLWPIHGWLDWLQAVVIGCGLFFFGVGGFAAFFNSTSVSLDAPALPGGLAGGAEAGGDLSPGVSEATEAVDSSLSGSVQLP